MPCYLMTVLAWFDILYSEEFNDRLCSFQFKRLVLTKTTVVGTEWELFRIGFERVANCSHLELFCLI